MSDIFQPNDPTLPLILPERVVWGEIYDPISCLVNYVNALFQAGFSPETLRGDLCDLYLLDFYDAQVRNGGHSQFIHNSHGDHIKNLEAALRGTQLIDLPDLADIITACRDFCLANPDLAQEQDGFETRAGALDDLDSRLYALKFTPPERADYIAGLPEVAQGPLQAKFAFEGLEEAREKIRAHLSNISPWDKAKDVVPAALAHGADVVTALKGRGYGPHPSDEKTNSVQKELDRLSHSIARYTLKDVPHAQWGEKAAQAFVDKVTDAGLYDTSRYHLATAAWVLQEKTLQIVPSSDVQDTVAAMVAKAPFAAAELDKRTLKQIEQNLPDGPRFALSFALNNIKAKDGKPVKFSRVLNSYGPYKTYEETHIIDTSHLRLFLCKTKTAVSLHSIQQTWRYRIASRLQKFGLISARRMAKILGPSQGAQGMGVHMPGGGIMNLDNPLGSLNAQIPGPKLSEAPLPADPFDLWSRLYVAEALMLWNVEKPPAGYAYDFVNGRVAEWSAAPPSVVYVYQTKQEEITIRADDQGVRMTNAATDQDDFFARPTLEDHRAAILSGGMP